MANISKIILPKHKEVSEMKNSVLWSLRILLILSFPALSLYIFSQQGSYYNFNIVGLSILLGLACTAGGILFGFIFSIPRSMTSDEDEKGKAYRANANLEQISDWLTKIIVGVGLVEFNAIERKLKQFVDYLAPSFVEIYEPRALIFSTIIFYFMMGFIMGYVYTRLYASALFRWADDALINKVNELVKQNNNDKKVLDILSSWLKSLRSGPQPSRIEFFEAVKNASPGIRSTAYFRARIFRKSKEQKMSKINSELLDEIIAARKKIKDTNGTGYQAPRQLIQLLDLDKDILEEKFSFEIAEIIDSLKNEKVIAINGINEINKKIDLYWDKIKAHGAILKNAIDVYKALIEDDEENEENEKKYSSNYTQLGHIYYDLGRIENEKRNEYFDEAIKSYELAIKVRNNNDEIDDYYELMHAISLFYRQKGKMTTEMKDQIEKAINRIRNESRISILVKDVIMIKKWFDEGKHEK